MVLRRISGARCDAPRSTTEDRSRTESPKNFRRRLRRWGTARSFPKSPTVPDGRSAVREQLSIQGLPLTTKPPPEMSPAHRPKCAVICPSPNSVLQPYFPPGPSRRLRDRPGAHDTATSIDFAGARAVPPALSHSSPTLESALRCNQMPQPRLDAATCIHPAHAPAFAAYHHVGSPPRCDVAPPKSSAHPSNQYQNFRQ